MVILDKRNSIRNKVYIIAHCTNFQQSRTNKKDALKLEKDLYVAMLNKYQSVKWEFFGVPPQTPQEYFRFESHLTYYKNVDSAICTNDKEKFFKAIEKLFSFAIPKNGACK